MNENKRQNRSDRNNNNPAAEVNAAAVTPQAAPAVVATPEPQAEPLQVGAPLIDDEPTAEEEQNPYRRIFEDVRFETSETDTVYTNDRDGLQSKKIAAAVVIFTGGFAGVPATVYARKPKNGNAYADVTFMGTRNTNAIKPLDEQSKADLMEFRRYLAEKFIEWRATQKPITRAASRAAAGVPIDGVTFG